MAKITNICPVPTVNVTSVAEPVKRAPEITIRDSHCEGEVVVVLPKGDSRSDGKIDATRFGN